MSVKIVRLKKEAPLSEDTKRFRPQWTDQDCINHLREIAEAQPEKIITRNYFRNNSKISESTWVRYFGDWAEFKRQANIIPSRYQTKMERAIAIHASVDPMRVMNKEKRDWEGKYKKPSDSRWQTVMVCSDVHDIECDPFWRSCFIDTLKRVQPEKVVLNGDIFDLPEFGKYTVDPREWDVVKRIKWVHKFLADIRNAAPNTEINFLEGNHEYRLLRHLSDESPAMKVVLSDLHMMTVPKLLGLTEYEVNYIAPADLATFTKPDVKAEIARNWMLIHGFLVAHHFPQGFNMGMPGWNGHHHTHLVKTGFNPVQGSYEWHQLGAGHKRMASYCDGERWTNGFLIAHVDTVKKNAVMEYVDIKDHAVIGGKWFTRSE